MSDNFPILIDVEEHQVGKVLRQLDVMPGVVTIHLKMSRGGRPGHISQQQQIAAPTKRGRPPGSSLGGPQLMSDATEPSKAILQALSKGSLHYKILEMAIVKNGYAATSVYKYIRILRDKKLIKRVAAGTYRLTERGEKRVPGINFDKPSLSGPDRVPDHSSVGRRGFLKSIILSAIAERGKMSHEELRNLIAANGYANNNLYTKVVRMKEEGLLKREGNYYEVTEMGREAITAPVNETINNGDEV